jgi:hypothetical protein
MRGQPAKSATIALAMLEVGAVASLSEVGRAPTAFFLTARSARQHLRRVQLLTGRKP